MARENKSKWSLWQACMLLCVDFCGGYCSFLVNYIISGTWKKPSCESTESSARPLKKKISCQTQKCNFWKRPSTDFDKNYFFGIGTSSAIQWYLSFILSISWPSDEPCPQRVSGSARTNSRRAESARNPISVHVKFGDDSALNALTCT